MSENIRVSEVSDILRKQLEGINTNVQLDEIGMDCGTPKPTNCWSLTTASKPL